MTEQFFRDRLRYLRNERKISAREMSIELGQNEAYINKLETGKCSISMSSFFRICSYLEISPSDFFNENINNSQISDSEILSLFRKLSQKQSKYIKELISDLVK